MFEEQLNAFEKFSQLKVGALFMEMGTGKTKVALELVNYNEVDLLLYFCPFSTKQNVINEIEKWGVNCEYKVIGFETISSSDNTFLNTLEYVENKKVFIIADESIFIKNNETKRHNRLIRIRNKCEYALILNGTPISKSEWDIYHQFQFLSYKIFDMSESEFNATFFDKITYKKRYEKPNTFYKFSKVNAESFSKIIEPYVVNSKLNIDVNVNEVFKDVDIDLSDYNEHKLVELDKMKNEMSLEAILSLLTSLSKIAALDKDKNKQVADYIEGKQIIVYCNFLKEVDILSNSIDCFVITGSTKQSERRLIIEQFKQSKKPLIMTFGVGSYSLNLQFCNEIVYSSLNFDYSKFEQSKYRIKRIGQDRDITYTYFFANCGINNMMKTSLEQKENLATLIKKEIKKGGNGDWLKSI